MLKCPLAERNWLSVEVWLHRRKKRTTEIPHPVLYQEGGQNLWPANWNSVDKQRPSLTSEINLSEAALMFHAVWTPLPPLLQAVCGQLMNIKMSSFYPLTHSLSSTHQVWIDQANICPGDVFKSFRSCLSPEVHCVSQLLCQKMCKTDQCPLEDINVQVQEILSMTVRKLWQVDVQLQEDMLLITKYAEQSVEEKK